MGKGEILAELRGQERDAIAVGSGVEVLRPELERLAHLKPAPRALNKPSPSWVARMVARASKEDKLYELEPEYVSPRRFGVRCE